MADGEVKLKLSAETQQAGKDLQAFSKEIDKISAKTEKLQAKLDRLSFARAEKYKMSSIPYERMEAYTKEIDELNEKMARLEDRGKALAKVVKELSTQPTTKLADFMTNYPSLKGLATANANRWGANKEDAERLIEGEKELAEIQKQLNDLYARGKHAEEEYFRFKAVYMENIPEKSAEEIQLENELIRLTQQKTEAEQQYISAKEAYKSKVAEEMQENQAYEQRQRVMSALGKSASLLATTLAKATSNATKFVLSLPLNIIKKRFDKLTHSVKRFGQRLKFVILQGLIFRNLRKYLSEFASSVGEALKKNNEFSASLANLKGAFWSALAPVIDAIAPILARFLNMIAELIAYLSAVISLLFGIGKASADAGKALTDAGEAGKKAGKNLAPFDTIQNLDTGSGGAGSGSGISPTFGQDFDEAYEKLEWLRKLLEEGDWFQIGVKVGQLFNKVMKQVNKFIQQLSAKAKKFAKDASDFLNGFFTSFDGYDFGTIFANTFNGIVDAIATFFQNIDMAKIGTSIGDAINGALLNIDVYRLAEALSSVLTKTLDLFNNMLSEIDWNSIGTNIGIFLSEIDWEGVIRGVIELIGNVIKGLWGLLTGVIRGLFMDDAAKLEYESEQAYARFEQNQEKRQKQLEDLGLQEQLTHDLIDRLYELQDKADKSNVEMDEMESIVRQLNTMYPGLNLELDKQNGYLNLGKDYVEDYTDALIRQYRVEAYKEQIYDITKELIDAEKEEKKAKTDLITATEGLNTAQRNHKKILDDLDAAQRELDKLHGDSTAPGYQELSDRVLELTQLSAGYGAEVGRNQRLVDLATKEHQNYADVVEGLNTELTEITSALSDATKAMSDSGEAATNTGDATTDMADKSGVAAEEFHDNMENIKTDAQDMANTVGDEAGNAADAFGKKFEGLPSVLNGIMDNAGSFMTKTFKGYLNGILGSTDGAIGSITKGLNAISFKVPDWIPGVGGSNFAFNINKPTIQRLAHGTVVNPGHEFTAILGDNRYEQEVVSPLSTMKQALIEALSEYGGDRGQIILEVDGREIATAIVPKINHITRAYGKSVIK